MASFDFRDIQVTADRFEGLQGFESWRRLYREPSYQHLQDLRNDALNLPDATKGLTCPRVFVSHRQADGLLALRVANIACDQSMEYWLDVDDQFLKNLLRANFTDEQKAFLTAGIIEMALINCSHVIAIMTKHTKGSYWVPYEYGRIADLPTCSGRAACWQDCQLVEPPEYLMLGVVTRTEEEIIKWLRDEKKAWSGGSCGCVWGGGITWPLPP